MERPDPNDLQRTIAMQAVDKPDEKADPEDLHRTVAMNVVVPPAGAPLPAPLAKAALQSTVAFTPPTRAPQALEGTMAMAPEQHAAMKAQALALVQAHQQQQQQPHPGSQPPQPHPGSQPPMRAAAAYVPPHVQHQHQQQQQAHLAAQQAQARTQMPVVKPCSPTADPRLVMLSEPKGAQAAGFRLLRDTLVAKGLPRVLAVSACAEEDGTTTCAVNLALALGEQPTGKVLLVDANFAKPALAALLGVEAPPAEGAPASWCAPFTVSALSAAVHVATIAQQPGQSESYVDLTTFKRLLETFFRAGYQHVIIDMPPVESSPEAALLMHLAGGVLLAVHAGSSTTGALRKAVDRIGDKALGVALMDA